jgi:hypothetical protein
VSDTEKQVARVNKLRSAITKLAAESVKMSEYTPGNFWALMNLPGQSSKTFYRGSVKGHAEFMCQVARQAIEHALMYAVLVSLGTAETANEQLERNGFIHIGHDFLRNADEIAGAIAHQSKTFLGLDASAASHGRKDAAGGDSQRPSLTLSPVEVCEIRDEIDPPPCRDRLSAAELANNVALRNALDSEAS